MCEQCYYWKKGFWEIFRFLSLEEFKKREGAYRMILNGKTIRSIPTPREIDIKKISVEAYQPDRYSLLILSQNTALSWEGTIIRGRRFWNHRIFSGLAIYCTTNDGRTLKITETANRVDMLIKNIYFS